MATQLSSLRRNAKLDIKGVKRPTLPTKVVELPCENGHVKTIQVMPHNQNFFQAEFEEDPKSESCGMLYTSKKWPIDGRAMHTAQTVLSN